MPSDRLRLIALTHSPPLFASVTICSATLLNSFARGTVVRIRSCSISEVVMFLPINNPTHTSPEHCGSMRRLASQLTEVHSVLHSHSQLPILWKQTRHIISMSFICLIRSPSVAIFSFSSLTSLLGKTITPSLTTHAL